MSQINWKEQLASLKLFILMLLLVGGLYPLVLTVIGQLVFPFQAKGSLIRQNQHIIGSLLLGQSFSAPFYFVGRPSLTNYISDEFTPEQVLLRGEKNLQSFSALQIEKWGNYPIPEELLYPSASMLDPHVTWATIMLQLPSVAKARELSLQELYHFVENHGFQEKLVNVLQLNLALDREYKHS
jgi:K+-transporting ATPase ATPase C chain